MKLEQEDKMFALGTISAAIAAGLLALIPFWQLVVIAGIIGGYFNQRMRRSILSGALGVCAYWTGYAIYFMITINAYVILDQIGGLFLAEGFGWFILLIILGMGAIFGALGGALGNVMRILTKEKTTERAD
ncbi:MAG: hypothetical protein ACTSU4_10870 [Promethearchaeota archaeon]